MSDERAERASRSPRHYGGLSAEARLAQRRARLIEAGFLAFGTRGYASTTIEGLCADAGVTARHFYEAFESREALLRAVFVEVVERARIATNAALAEASSSELARIERSVRAFLDAVLVDEKNARVLCIEVVGVSPELEASRRDVLRAFADLVVRILVASRPDIPASEPRLRIAATLVVGGMNEVVVDWLGQEQRPALDGLAKDLVSLFAAMIRGFVP